MCADCITLPELFRARGYRTAGAGKLQHKREWSIDADESGRSRGFTEPFVRVPLLERKGVRENGPNGRQMYHSHATPPVRAVREAAVRPHGSDRAGRCRGGADSDLRPFDGAFDGDVLRETRSAAALQQAVPRAYRELYAQYSSSA